MNVYKEFISVYLTLFLNVPTGDRVYKGEFKVNSEKSNLFQIEGSSFLFNHLTIHVPITHKSVNWITQRINWLASIWWEH